jgi:hypothetical protein
MTHSYNPDIDWLELFNNSDKKEDKTNKKNEDICKGHFIICEFTSPCLFKSEPNEQYCTQHKTRYRFEKPKECLICFEELVTTVTIPLSCGHWFHKNCIKKSKNHQCPLCRHIIYREDILYFMGKRYKTKLDILNANIIFYDELDKIKTEMIIECLINKFERIQEYDLIRRLKNIKSKLIILDENEEKFVRSVLIYCMSREKRFITYWSILLKYKLDNNIFLLEISENVPDRVIDTPPQINEQPHVSNQNILIKLFKYYLKCFRCFRL